MFTGGAVGLILQRLLPDEFTPGGPRDTIGAVVGLLTLLSALVLGLLIWTAFGLYAGQNLAVQTLAAKVRNSISPSTTMDPRRAEDARFFGRSSPGPSNRIGTQIQATANSPHTISPRRSAIYDIRTARSNPSILRPTMRSGRWRRRGRRSIGSASSGCGCRFALHRAVSCPLVDVVVGWGVALFCGFGLMPKVNAMSVVALVFGALAVTSAIYLILDLSSPYSGLFRTPPAPLQQVLAQMSQGQGAVGGSR